MTPEIAGIHSATRSNSIPQTITLSLHYHSFLVDTRFHCQICTSYLTMRAVHSTCMFQSTLFYQTLITYSGKKHSTKEQTMEERNAD